MRNLKFKYARAVNFLCFGPNGIEINFEQLGPIVFVRGQNLDVSDHASSNGSGKSSLPEIPVYALYGKTIKKHKKLHQANVINFITGKKMEVEFRWDNFRVIRGIEPSKLRLWESPDGVWNKQTEITRGGPGATQKLIEEKIGLNYETFVNLYIINADDPTSSFLECDIPTKREIVENLLSLDKYREYYENAKSLVKTAKEKIALLARDYGYLLESMQACQERLANIEQQENIWKADRNKEIANLAQLLKENTEKLESTDIGTALLEYTESQNRIEDLKKLIKTLEGNRDNCQEAIVLSEDKCKEYEAFITDLEPRYNKASNHLQICRNTIESSKEILQEIADKISSGNCRYCLRPIDPSLFDITSRQAEAVIKQESDKLNDLQKIWSDLEKLRSEKKSGLERVHAISTAARKKLEKINSEIADAYTHIRDFAKIKEPKSGVEERLLKERIDDLIKKIQEKKAEGSPFTSIKDNAAAELVSKKKEIDDKKAEVEKAEKELPYYNFWVKGFGDTGIRKYIIDGIIPILNNQIAYWLQFLIDNKISLVFDDQLKETIDRWPFQNRPYIYHGLSGGQRRRLNLSIAPSFGHIMSLNAGCSLSTIWLDEVSMNMDEAGVDGIYKLICELAKEKQVFVIDHNQSLLQLLEGCDLIQLEMKELVTTKVK